VSGRCAALERDLLDGAFFRELLDAPDAAAAAALLGKTTYGELFPHPASLEAYDRVLDGHLRECLDSLGEGCPPDGPVDIVRREAELRDVHGLLAESDVARGSAEEVERWASRLGGGHPWLAGFSVPAERRGLFASQPVRAFSLWTDSAFLGELRRIAAARPGLAPFLDARISLAVLGVCWRAFREGLGMEWLDGFFFRDALAAPPRRALAGAGKDPAALAKLIAPPGFEPTAEKFDETFGRQADDFLTAVARGAAYEVSGPGRVLFYVRMLWVEHLNLRLCIAAVLTPLDRADVRTRLRNG